MHTVTVTVLLVAAVLGAAVPGAKCAPPPQCPSTFVQPRPHTQVFALGGFDQAVLVHVDDVTGDDVPDFFTYRTGTVVGLTLGTGWGAEREVLVDGGTPFSGGSSDARYSALGDIDNDGVDDFVMVGSPNGYWFRGLGGNTFAGGAVFASSDILNEVTIVDLDLDGDNDLMLSSDSVSATLGLAYLRNDGSTPGSLSLTPVVIDTGKRFTSHFVGHLDSDGFADVAVTTTYSQTVDVYTTARSAPLSKLSFSQRLTGSIATVVTMFDVDNDGWLDIISVNQGGLAIASPVRVFFNLGAGDGLVNTGGLTLDTTGAAQYAQTAIAFDYNRDGVTDLIESGPGDPTSAIIVNGVRDDSTQWAQTPPVVFSLVPNDNPRHRNVIPYIRADGGGYVFIPTDDGVWSWELGRLGNFSTPMTLAPAPIAGTLAVAAHGAYSAVPIMATAVLPTVTNVSHVPPLADGTPGPLTTLFVVDGNPVVAVVAAGWSSSVVSVAALTATHFHTADAPPVALPSAAVGFATATPAYLDADAFADVLVGNATHVVAVFNPALGGADGGATVVFDAGGGGGLVRPVVANLDGLFGLDVAVADASSGDVVVVLAASVAGTFATPAVVAAGAAVGTPALMGGLFSGDADASMADLAFVALPSTVMVLANAAPWGTFATPAATLFTTSSLGTAIASVAADDLTGDGLTDVVVSSPVATNAEVWASSAIAPHFLDATVPMPGGAAELAVGDVTASGFGSVIAVDASGSVVVSAHLPSTFSYPLAARGVVPLHPESGGRVNTMASLRAALARHSECLGKKTLDLRGAVFSGCVRDGAHIAITMPIEIANAVFDCGAGGGGVLFSVAGTELTLRNVTIRGARPSVSPLAQAPQALYVHGSGGRLTLTDVVVEGCSTEGTSASVDNAGLGGALLVTDLASLVASNVVFRANTASGSGGAAAVVGAVTLSAVVFEANTALGVLPGITGLRGGGGLVVSSFAVAVDVSDTTFAHNVVGAGSGGGALITLTSCTLRLDTVVFESNAASAGAGGGLALSSPSSSTMSVRNATFASNTAYFGGSLSLTKDAVPVGTTSPVGLPLYTFPRFAVEIVDVVVSGSRAVYGGVMYSCGLDVSSSSSVPAVLVADRAEAEIGGVGFECVAPQPAALSGGSGAVAVPVAASASLYGITFATTVVSLSVSGVPAEAVSGQAVGSGVVVGEDAFGAVVVDPRLAVTISVAGGLAAVSGLENGGGGYSAEAGGYVVGTAAFAAYFWPASLGHMIEYTVAVAGSTDSPVATGSIALLACPPGFGRTSEASGALVCTACADGSFSLETSTAACTPEVVCTGDDIVVNNTCVPCPVLTFRDAVNTSAPGYSPGDPGPCVCSPGAWSPKGLVDVPCEPCPVGGVCAGRLAVPVAAPGWYPKEVGSGASFVACRADDACVGGTTCGEAYAPGAYMCKDCVKGKSFRTDTGSCEKCPDHKYLLIGVLVAVVVVVAGVVFVGMLIVMRGLRTKVGGLGEEWMTKGKGVPHAVSAGFLFVQVLGLLAVDTFNWPSPPVKDVLLWSTLANAAPVKLLRTECSISSFYIMYLLQVVLPVLFSGVMAVLTVVCTGAGLCGMGKMSAKAFLSRLFFTIGPLVYIPVSRSSLTFFNCVRLPDDKWYMESDLSVECFSSTWLSFLPVAVCAVAVYVVCLPAVIGRTLWKNREALHSPTVFLRYSPAYAQYRTAQYLHDIVLLVKRLCIVCVSLFFRESAVLLFSGLVLVFVISLVYQTRTQPFVSVAANNLEQQLDTALLVIIFFGVLFWADRFGNNVQLVVCAFVVLGIIACGVAAVLAAFVRETREDAVAMTHGRLFSFLAEAVGDVHDAALLDAIGRVIELEQRGPELTWGGGGEVEAWQSGSGTDGEMAETLNELLTDSDSDTSSGLSMDSRSWARPGRTSGTRPVLRSASLPPEEEY